jgi:threonine-phosphate decarboxylase
MKTGEGGRMANDLPPHGGGVFRRAAENGIEIDQIVDFSANINPLGLPPGVKEELYDSLDYLAHYPEIDAATLQRQLAGRHRLAAENILVGNGSTALIYLLARILKPHRALLLIPTFTEYERALRLVGCRIDYLAYWRAGRLLPGDEIKAAVDNINPEMVFVCNPGNPTGSLLAPHCLLNLIRGREPAGTVWVLDEAFIDFTEPGNSLIRQVTKSANLLILRSLTKIYALAGLRCGYLAGSRELVARLRCAQEPWSLNYPVIRAAVTALANDREFLEMTRTLIGRERSYLFDELVKFFWLEPFPSRANYLLCRLHKGVESRLLADYLFAREAILIRRCGDYPGLGDDFIRFAVRRPEDNRRLITCLKQFNADL